MNQQVGPTPPVDGDSTGEPIPTQPAARKAGRAVREIVETLLLAALIFFAVRMVVLNFRVDGSSMAPNLENEQMLLVNRNAYRSIDLDWLGNLIPGAAAAEGTGFYPFDPPERGDIVVFDPPTNSDKPYIKRIIGLPGERVTFNEDHVLINGLPLDEAYIGKRTTCSRNEVCDVVVPEGSIFVMGDNRNNSSDSRSFGVVPIEDVVGKAWFSYWPLGDIGFVPHYDYAGVSDRPMEPVASGIGASVGSAGTPTAERQRERREERPRRTEDERERAGRATPAAS